MRVDPFKTGLHQGNAYWMAVLSSMAYEDYENDGAYILEKLQKERYGRGFQKVKPFSENSSQGIFVEHDDFLAMAFRGTDEFADMLDNVNVKKKETPFGDFHTGFWDALHDIWGGMYPFYMSICNKGKQNVRFDKKGKKLASIDMSAIKVRRPLFITGHSLGGAMATAAAAKLLEDGFDRPFASVYTFGQPRAMAADAAKKFESYIGNRFFRFQNNNDIVTRLPTRVFGYSHVGKCIYIDADEEIHNDPGLWFRFLDAVEGVGDAVKDIMQEGLSISGVIDDHKMENYINAIRDAKAFPND